VNLDTYEGSAVVWKDGEFHACQGMFWPHASLPQITDFTVGGFKIALTGGVVRVLGRLVGLGVMDRGSYVNVRFPFDGRVRR
jgi:hypothetical protein